MAEQQTDSKTSTAAQPAQTTATGAMLPERSVLARVQLKAGLHAMGYEDQSSLLGFDPVQRSARAEAAHARGDSDAGERGEAGPGQAQSGGTTARAPRRTVQRLVVQRSDAVPPDAAAPPAPPPIGPTNFSSVDELKIALRQERRSLAIDAIDLWKTHDATVTDDLVMSHFRGDFAGAATQYEAYRREMGLYQHIAQLYLNWCARKNLPDPKTASMDQFLAEVQPLHDLSQMQLTRSLLDWCADKIAELPHPVVDVQSADEVKASTPAPNAGKLEFQLTVGPYKFCTVWIDVDAAGKPYGMSEYIFPRAAEAEDPGTGYPVHADLRAPFAWTFVGLQKSIEVLLNVFPTQLQGQEKFDAHGDMDADNLTHFQTEYAKAKLEEPASSPARLGQLAISRISFGIHRMRLGATINDFTVTIASFDGDAPMDVAAHCWVPIRTRT